MSAPQESPRRRALKRARALLAGLEGPEIAAIVCDIDRALGAAGSGDATERKETKPREGFSSEAPTGTRLRQADPAPRASAETASPAELLDVALHDIKDPLAALVMGAAFLGRVIPEGEPGERARRLVGAMQRSADRLNRTVQNLLDFARLERGRLALSYGDHDLHGIVAEAATRLAARAKERHVSLVQDLPDGALPVHADLERIVQTIVHLGANAIRYAPEGSDVTLRARVDGGAASVSVTDRGPGIAGERREHIFDRHYHLRRTPREGTGLGLAIARGFVEAHRGRLRLDAAGPGGTTFTFTFPS
jgi:two-component system sensor histidine kinase KdpD